MINNYIMADCDDWVGLYLNGDLIYQDHSLGADTAFDIIMEHGGTVHSYEHKSVNYDWMDTEMGGSLPDDILDVKFD